MKLDDYTALVWVHGATTTLNPRHKYFQGKRRIPAPLTVRRHAGRYKAAGDRSLVERDCSYRLAAAEIRRGLVENLTAQG